MDDFDIDEDLGNADWLKMMSWDLPTDPDTFLTVIGGEGKLAAFMLLPASLAMPDDLREALGV